jgi:hypothetical protein
VPVVVCSNWKAAVIVSRSLPATAILAVIGAAALPATKRR